MWSETHRPRSIEDMVGNDEVRARLLSWLTKWKKGSKALLLIGPPGTGKTTSVQLAAKRLGLNLVQLNASDRRTKDMLAQKLGETLLSSNLFGDRTLVFLDEVDGLAGRSDYGAIDFIKESIKKSQHPIVMAANDPDSDEVKKLSSVCTGLLFVKPSDKEVEGHLKKVARLERLEIPDDELGRIAASSRGDIRASINALQGGAPSTKDEDQTAAQALNGFFDSDKTEEALKSLRAYPGQAREKIRDIFTSLVRSKLHLKRKADSLEAVSRADVLVGRMMRGQNWRLLRYLDPLLATDLRAAMGDGGVRYAGDATPWPLLLRIWNDSKKLKDIGRLAGRRLGISQRGFMTEDMPYLMLLCSDDVFRDEVVRSLGLEENYAAFVTKEASRMARR